MAQITLNQPIAEIHGALSKRSNIVNRQKKYRINGRVIHEGKQEAYAIVNPRDWKFTTNYELNNQPRPLFFAIVCSFTYGVPENARGVLGCLTNNIWVSLVLSRHLFCFCQYSGKYPCLYTLHPTRYTKKIALQGDFSCTIQNISLPLQAIW